MRYGARELFQLARRDAISCAMKLASSRRFGVGNPQSIPEDPAVVGTVRGMGFRA